VDSTKWGSTSDEEGLEIKEDFLSLNRDSKEEKG
jgi:hypothetical protein